MTTPKNTPNPAIVALMLDTDMERFAAAAGGGWPAVRAALAHLDGRPFTDEEADLFGEAGQAEFEAAAQELHDRSAGRTLEAHLHEVAIRLIEDTPGAKTLNDVSRIRGGKPLAELLSEASGIDVATVVRVMNGGQP